MTIGNKFRLTSLRYVVFVFFMTSLFISVVAGLLYKKNHVYLFPSQGWYLDLGGKHITEVQDQDIFYHHLNASIDYLKKADIIIMGSSFLQYGINELVIHRMLEKKYGLKFYNMAFVGVSSGDFSKKIIKKYKIHPQLWIINVDDSNGTGGFFSTSMMRAFCQDVKKISTVNYGRLEAFRKMIGRQIRWGIEDLLWDYNKGKKISSFLFRSRVDTVLPYFYRNMKTGEGDMSPFHRYMDTSNEKIAIMRDPQCHTTEEIIRNAKKFIKSIGGQVILTLVPHTNYCAAQARELAQALKVELILTERTDYTSYDGGGHLDHKGSIQFTTDFLSLLVHSKTFRRVIDKKQQS